MSPKETPFYILILVFGFMFHKLMNLCDLCPVFSAKKYFRKPFELFGRKCGHLATMVSVVGSLNIYFSSLLP
jgi:hypothetical protein